jgi:hypothetical protein
MICEYYNVPVNMLPIVDHYGAMGVLFAFALSRKAFITFDICFHLPACPSFFPHVSLRLQTEGFRDILYWGFV